MSGAMIFGIVHEDDRVSSPILVLDIQGGHELSKEYLHDEGIGVRLS